MLKKIVNIPLAGGGSEGGVGGGAVAPHILLWGGEGLDFKDFLNSIS